MSSALPHHHPLLQVVICDRREFDRAALRLLCSHDGDLSVVAEVDHPDQLTGAVPPGCGVVVLVGRSMLRDHGHEQVQQIRRDAPQARIVVVDISGELGQLGAAELGGDGFLQRDGELADQLSVVSGI